MMNTVIVLEALIQAGHDGEDHVIGVFLNKGQVKIAIETHGKLTDRAYVYRTVECKVGELHP